MITLHDIARTPTLLAAKLRKLERQGRFADALKDCLVIVDREAHVPSMEAATREERAELLLRYGALIGFLGVNSQIANSQEQSKDLLTQAMAEFIAIGNEEKVAECENYLAVSYARLGEFNEARVWLDSSFARSISRLSEPRIAWYGIVSLIQNDQRRFSDTIALLAPVESDVLTFDDPYLLGIYYGNLGIALKDTGRLAEALSCFDKSRLYHKISRHKIYTGTVENNIALLYRDLRNFPKSHAAIDAAIETFKKAGDKTRSGYALDTKANIFLSQGELKKALAAIDKSIDVLKRGENALFRVESLLTRSKILLHLDRFADATMTLLEAVDIQRMKVDEDAARQLIEEFEVEWKHLHAGKQRRSKAATSNGSEDMQLLLPQSLSGHGSYSAVRINNSHLEHYGLRPGMLAVLVDEKVSRGDLVAIEELTNGSVRCGVFDSEFGLVCLERGDAEPELFDENTVRVLGKIVGVADNEKMNSRGEVIVEPIAI